MKVTVKDKEIFQTIDPNVLAAHLETNGWQKIALVYENTWIWHKKNDAGQIFEIKQPVRQEFDAPQLIAEAFKTLEVIENRSQLEILSDLITALPNVAISGWINKVYGAESPGQITLIGFVVGKLRKINLELPEADYQLALKAYESRSPVTCFGDLIKENDGFVLNNPRDFALLSEAELIS
ncbi:hypothetical protein [Microcoleus sp. PH2017_28_MFU_U_A]|uniref:hypothetical protein n=1 Tax=Microcoleus sp. PH2017_28_MFU_U_A TaxID=2798838 RepID=UPI001E1947AF|nr:hypothetical protein [Microcoleus sp. PH2017_28_MFU_U_A]MCC3594111.1 hypothetical protein [Microcoleus sp. PH2017_28_MFU_U_A]